MKKAILLFLVAMLMAWPFAVAEETEGNMTTYVVDDEPDEEPVDEEPADEEPTGEEPTDEEPVDEEPADEEPTGEEPTDEEPVDEEPADEEPADEEPIVDIPEEVVEEAGITPDSPLYGLERAIERISLKLTLGKSAKAKKGLAHARERLMEVQAMIAAKKLDAAAEAQEEHDEIMDEVNEQVADLGDGDVGEELADELELEAALEEHEDVVAQVNAVTLEAKGSLSPEQEAQVGALVASLEASAVEAKMNVQVKKEKTKIKIKATEGLTDEELDALEAQAREIVGQGGKVKIIGKKSKGRSTTETSDEEPEEPEEGDEEPEEGETEGEEEEPAKGNKGKGKGKNK